MNAEILEWLTGGALFATGLYAASKLGHTMHLNETYWFMEGAPQKVDIGYKDVHSIDAIALELRNELREPPLVHVDGIVARIVFHGKTGRELSFELEDSTGRIPVYRSSGAAGLGDVAAYEFHLNEGDHVQITGLPITAKVGSELSIAVDGNLRTHLRKHYAPLLAEQTEPHALFIKEINVTEMALPQ